MNQSEWANKDYYADLGVSKTASAEDIKKAYRKLARDNHPDSHPGDAAAEERFKKISEAHSVIGDESKRKEYDEFKSMLSSGGLGGGYGGGFGPDQAEPDQAEPKPFRTEQLGPHSTEQQLAADTSDTHTSEGNT